MDRRLELDALLRTVGETENVYFQPPETIKMAYPAIVYFRGRDNTRHADNRIYKRLKGYEVTYITRDPDSDVPDKIGDLQYCRQARKPYVADNLYHHVYELYF